LERALSLLDVKVGHGPSDINAAPVGVRCPHCGKNGSFQAFKPFGVSHRATPQSAAMLTVAPRACPDPECRGLIFTFSYGAKVLLTVPPETLDFDSTALPERVRSALEEAVQCHAASCFRASAIMVRRTLEELCADRGATGKNLKQRLADLGGKIVLPKELLDALDHLRVLGNDAAHLESHAYDKIGKEEVEVAIEISKEILKATYQYNSLVAKLRALGKEGEPSA
jgi:hypothetical protein